MLSKNELIEHLCLEPHPKESGYFKRNYSSDEKFVTDSKNRNIMTCIYYMLSDDKPNGAMHKNLSDIVHFYHGGGAIKYWVISPEGVSSEYILGNDLANGEQLQLVVKGGYWKASQLIRGDFVLLGEAVAPGFDYADHILATEEDIISLCPHLLKKFQSHMYDS
jgi:predicted cupin superfamily sugar epimerase